MKYNIILFDADETLFDFKLSEKTALQNALTAFGVNYSESVHLTAYKKINTAIWDDLEKGLIQQADLKVERFRRYLSHMNLDISPVEMATKYEYMLGEASILFENSYEVVEKMSQRAKLFIVTNGLTSVQTRRIGKSKISHFFEAIFISEQIGVAKPNPDIFEKSLANYAPYDKSKILMVGDSLTSDIQGGINFGVDTCWYNPRHLQKPSHISPTYEIHQLETLLTLV